MGKTLALNESFSFKKLLIAVLALLAIVGSVNASSWTEKISLKGDLRYRFEYCGKEHWYQAGGSWTTGDSLGTPRYRNRVRARLGIVAKPEDDLEIGLRLATGSDDPVSTNQTFDKAFSTKGIQLDRAYFKWKPVEGLWIEGGKYGLPWHLASKAFWDGDLAVEGLSLGWGSSFDAISPFVNINYLWVDEIKKDPKDVMLYLGQGGANFQFGSTKLLVAANYFTYTNLKHHGALHGGSYFGNTKTATDSLAVVDPVSGDTTGWNYTSYGYAYGYDVIQPSFKLSLKLGKFPVSIYGDLVYNINSEVKEQNMGYMFGLKLGKAKTPGSFELSADYGALAEDCTNATFVDSDFAGGGTDGNGLKFGGKLQITKKLQTGLVFFMNGLDPNNPDHGLAKYYRLQADLKMKF